MIDFCHIMLLGKTICWCYCCCNAGGRLTCGALNMLFMQWMLIRAVGCRPDFKL